LSIVDEYSVDNGLLNEDSLSPSLKESYLAYSNSFRLALQALGINAKKQKEIINLPKMEEDVKEEN